MGLFDHFPYTNVHELNLDWILSMMKALEAEWEAFTAGNSLTFSDPLLHDKTKTYAKNTIVLDSNGNAYVSLQAVPVGVTLSNQDYWLMVFDYEAFLEKVNKNFTARYYRDQYRATSAMAIGDWLTVDDVLCKATTAIAADDALEVGVNIEHFTLEDFIKAFMTSANQMIQQYKNAIDASELAYKNAIDASELAYRNQLAQDIADTTASLQAQLEAAISGATVDSEVINARIGINSSTYATLGDAIRNQIETINQLSDISILPNLAGDWYIGTDGSIASYAGWTCTELIEVYPGDKICFKGYGGGNHNFLVGALYDTNGTWLKALRYGDAAYAWDTFECKVHGKVRFCSFTGGGYPLCAFKIPYYLLTNSYVEAMSPDGLVNPIYGGYVEMDGTVSTSYPDNYYSEFKEVHSGDVVFLKCWYPSTGYPTLVKYDSNQTFERVLQKYCDYTKFTCYKMLTDGYIRIASFGGEHPPVAFIISSKQSGLAGLDLGAFIKNYTPKIILENTLIDGYLDQQHNVVAPLSNYKSLISEAYCNPGDQFYYYGFSGTGAWAYWLYNDDQLVSSYQYSAVNPGDPAMDFAEFIITIPEGVNNIKFASTHDSPNRVLITYQIPKVYKPANNVLSILNGKNITLIGDSITEYNWRAKYNFGMYFNMWCGANIQNLGLSGSGFAAGNTYINQIANIQSTPDIIGVGCSFNDMSAGLPIGTKTDTGTTTVAGYINDFFSSLISSFPTVPIICYCQGPWDSMHPGGSTTDDDYINVLRDICREKGIPFYDGLWFGSVLKPWISANRTVYYTSDNDDLGNTGVTDTVHPNSIGHKAIARYLYPKFAENIISTGLDYYI